MTSVFALMLASKKTARQFLQEQYDPENRPIDIFAWDIFINQSRQIPVAH